MKLVQFHDVRSMNTISLHGFFATVGGGGTRNLKKSGLPRIPQASGFTGFSTSHESARFSARGLRLDLELEQMGQVNLAPDCARRRF